MIALQSPGWKSNNTVKKTETSQSELAKMMVGRETFGVTRQEIQCEGEEIYTVSGVSLDGKHGRKVLDDITFSICSGEILGVAGVSGNGQGELTNVLTGLIKPTHGSIKVGEKEISHLHQAKFLMRVWAEHRRSPRRYDR